jgi:prepilin-type N-terminal cleavage/methylation domain-containing protein
MRVPTILSQDKQPMPERSGVALRYAFTLIEVIVVMGILGILIALAIPAVQVSRESARALQCPNNLKQIGIALAAHESSHQRLPSGFLPDTRTPAGEYMAAGPLSVQFQLLPLLEQSCLYRCPSTPIRRAK